MRFKFFYSLMLLALPWSVGWGCTEMAMVTQDGSVINGRSLEFAIPLHSKITLNPRGVHKESKASSNQKGLLWTSNYGYISVDVLDQGLTTDGMNEKGLSVGVLWFPGAQYPTSAPSTPSQAIVLHDLAGWLLGNFATTQEAKIALSKVEIWAETIEKLGLPPVHLAVHDVQGNSCVIEFVKGKMVVQENPNGVVTNFPSLEWHLMNLRNYLTLNPLNAPSRQLNGISLEPPSQGTGLHGIPGDWTSPSRFVKASFLKAFAVPAVNAALGVNLMQHILNTFDIPLGIVRGGNDPSTFELTQWIVIKDLKNRVFYYRTYQDLALRSIDLKKLNFSGPSKSILMQTDSTPIDMTQSFF